MAMPINILPPFQNFSTLVRYERGGKITYWRYCCSTSEHMFVIPAVLDRIPSDGLNLTRWELKSIFRLFGTVIQQIEELICPPWMLRPNLAEKDVISMNLKKSIIQPMLDEYGATELVRNESVRARCIAQAAAASGVAESYVRKQLGHHLYFGCHDHALMSLSLWKGAPGVSRRGTTRKKQGRPNFNVVLNPKTPHKGANMSNFYFYRLRRVVMEEYAANNRSAARCVDNFFSRLGATNDTVDELGHKVAFNIAREKIPERELCLKHATEIIRQLELREAKDGFKDWNQKTAASTGSSTDIIGDTVDVYDLDATEFNIELLYGEENPSPVGKPVVVLAVDRRSGAVVGWFVYAGRENTYAYKYCLFNAFTPKQERLERFKLKLDGFVYGVAEHICVDRGPAVSIAATEAFVGQLRLTMKICRPGHGSDKGDVEGVIGILQRKLDDLKGAFRRTDSARDKYNHKKAEAWAALYWEEFETLLMHAISDHNLSPIARKRLTNPMIQANVMPTPKAIFVYNRLRKRGDAAIQWATPTIYKRLLTSQELLAPEGKVTIQNAEYSSPGLRKHFNSWQQRPHRDRSPLVKVYRLPESDKTIIWEREDGSLEPLTMMSRSLMHYGNVPLYIHDVIDMRTKSNERVERNTAQLTLPGARKAIMEATEGRLRVKAKKGEKRQNRARKFAEQMGNQFADALDVLELKENGFAGSSSDALSLVQHYDDADAFSRRDNSW